MGMQTTQVFLRLPNVFNPTVWHSFLLNVTNGRRTFRQLDLGWNVTIRLSEEPTDPAQITPPSAPVEDSILGDEKSVSAMIILPEDDGIGGFNQYWVPVLERKRRALLKTPKWDVEFVRVPSFSS
jgi:hypothetical protein